MEIKIKTLEGGKIVISNEDLNNFNYVDLSVYDIDELAYIDTFTIPIDELSSAILSFNNLRDEQNKREKEYGYLEVK